LETGRRVSKQYYTAATTYHGMEWKRDDDDRDRRRVQDDSTSCSRSCDAVNCNINTNTNTNTTDETHRHRPYEINAMMLETAHEDTTIELDAHGPGGRRRGQKNNHLKFNNIAAQCADMNAFGCVYYGNEISLSRKYPIKGLFLN